MVSTISRIEEQCLDEVRPDKESLRQAVGFPADVGIADGAGRSQPPNKMSIHE